MRWRYPRIIAHRCGGALAPENTLAGLRIAARLGCRAVEFDAMLSADGVPVLIHDETVMRTTGGGGRVNSLGAAQLSALDAGARHHGAFAGERIPSLEEALALCAVLGLGANVEIKPSTGAETATGEAVTAVAFRMRQRHAELAVLLSSFSEDALAAAARTAPGIERALLVSRVPEDWQERMRRHDCVALHASASALDAATVRGVVEAGRPLACYTVNDPGNAGTLFGWGVAAVFSDRPDLFPPDGVANR